MVAVFILGLLGGIDNLQIASAAGLLGLHPKRRWILIISLIFCDVAMSLAGLLIGIKINILFENIVQWLGPAFILALGIYTLTRELLEKENHHIINKNWVLIFLPLIMSIDNLLAGIGLGTTGYPVISTFIIMGICSGVMCMLGLLLGEKVRSLLPGKVEIISGVYLIGLAVFLVIKK